MANAVLIEDTKGDLVEAEYFCSDFHAKSHSSYAGWYGCVELDFGQVCSAEGCSEQLHGVEQCECGNEDCLGFSKSH
jgi:hypothetical protein